jgi:hypothetical protein
VPSGLGAVPSQPGAVPSQLEAVLSQPGAVPSQPGGLEAHWEACWSELVPRLATLPDHPACLPQLAEELRGCSGLGRGLLRAWAWAWG